MTSYRKDSDIERVLNDIDGLRDEGAKVSMHLPWMASGSAGGFVDAIELHAHTDNLLNYTIVGMSCSDGRLEVEAEEIKEPMELRPVEIIEHRNERNQLVAVEFKQDGRLGGHFKIQHPAQDSA